jgi:hypothetical protein
LETSADDAGAAGFDQFFGYGRLNVYRAVAAAAALPGAIATTNAPGDPPPIVPPQNTNDPATVVFSSLTLLTNGFGHVGPNLNDHKLRVGKTYLIRAIPGSGQIFAGWGGASAAASPVLTFVMQTNLTLIANFILSPYPPFKGTYAGLIAGTNGVTPANAGYFSVSVTALGRFSGKILLAGSRHGFHGQLGLQGDGVLSLTRPHLATLTMKLRLDLTPGSDQITGTITDGAFVSEIGADRNVFNARSNPAVQAGVHPFALLLPDAGASSAAAGQGRIAPNGSANVHGSLSDRRHFMTGSTLSKNGDYPFYLSLNHGNEVVIGWLNFPAGQPAASGGNVLWVNTGTNSFARTLQAASSLTASTGN